MSSVLRYAYLMSKRLKQIPPVDERGKQAVEDIEQDFIPDGEEVILFPEPLDVLETFKKEMNPGDTIYNQQWLETYIETIRERFVPFQDRSSVQTEEQLWFRKTTDGIYLHPGIPSGFLSNDPIEVKLGDLNVHALVAGRTGSGKSVLLNTILMNLLHEHAPWELDLYLIDLKQVEFSRYVSYVPTWHIEAVAATSDVGYIMTLIQNIAEQMAARQQLFKLLGVQKLKDFRERFGVVLPRKLIVVDEFQQLFETKEGNVRREIEHHLDKITKLGRATGVHLIFASQDMSNTLSGSALSNFNVRLLLPSDENVSSALIGSSEGTQLQIGEAFIDMSITTEQKIKYNIEQSPVKIRVPFIQDKHDDILMEQKEEETNTLDYIKSVYRKNEFFSFLKMNYLFNEHVHFPGKHLKYFNETDLESAEQFSQMLDAIAEEKQQLLALERERLIEMLTLGESLQYSSVQYNYAPLFIERGRNKNVMILSSNAIDIAYILQLLALNMQHSKRTYQHFVLPLDVTVSAYFNVDEALHTSYTLRELDVLYQLFEKRVQLVRFFEQQHGAPFHTFAQFVLPTYGEAGTTLLSLLREDGTFHFDEVEQPEAFDPLINKIQADYEEIVQFWDQEYSRMDFIQQKFPLNVIWVMGIESLEGLSQYATMFEEATMYNFWFIFTAVTDEQAYYELSSYADYFFISGQNERFYARLDLPQYKRMHPETVFDAKHLSHNRNISFKRIAFEKKNSTLPTFDYDTILAQTLQN